MKLKLIGIVFAICLLVACPKNPAGTGAPGTVPQPPQVTVLQLDRALADADNVAATLVAKLYSEGKIPGPSANLLKNYLSAIAKASDAVALECQSSDTWPIARSKIVSSLAAVAFDAGIVSDPNLNQLVVNVQSLVNQILGVK